MSNAVGGVFLFFGVKISLSGVWLIFGVIYFLSVGTKLVLSNMPIVLVFGFAGKNYYERWT